jgi:hypothetical protein
MLCTVDEYSDTAFRGDELGVLRSEWTTLLASTPMDDARTVLGEVALLIERACEERLTVIFSGY